ncbi:hypothetical protein DFR70_10492 [Nocardia tenerifensis]|uniref:Transmembrane protein n=1 Tax=Nocardia tenerifensis TaxID=228006 RepID=A0A318K196_9NOCA|nr:hypothetical protein [Nocardia tenerifensis]PXX65031.1 hypothetical protein DFR70_10492 [Nocardia tenerifensis]
MSDDSKQLSVAELLARNGQQGASSAGGGRRRRGGRGISVAELTGDMPVIGGGHSSHAAPEEAPDEPAYEPPAYEPPASDPVAYAPPAPEPSAYSPISGPISMYDPLAAYAQPEPQADPLPGRSGLVMPGREMPESRYTPPADPLSGRAPVADLYAPSPNPYAPSPNPYAPSPNPYAQSPNPYASDPVPEEAPAPRSGRRRRHDDIDDPTEVRPPLHEVGGASPVDRRPADGRNGVAGGRAARRRAAEAEAEEAAPSTAAWSPTAADYDPDPVPLPEPAAPWAPTPEPPRRNGDGALPAWSARRRKTDAPQRNDAPPEPEGISTAAWSLASQDQQLVSGQTVAGDLLRDGVERAERADAERAAGRGKRGRADRDPVDELELYDGKTDFFEPVDLDAEHDELDDFDEDEPERAVSPRRSSRAARKAEDDANRRQWMILGGQSTGAAVAGMLLFKGFERMWEMLPWVALALAMIVILGLVALVRILRRTDDVLSTVIAVVVGVFVTLGPLAFLLSTN